MAEIIIHSTEGGFSTKSPLSMFDNQCQAAENVEWVKSKCGERRLGSTTVDLSGLAAIDGIDTILHMHQHFPTATMSDEQLWVFGLESGTVKAFYKDTTWHEVTIVDAFTVDGLSEYQIQTQTLHGKLFIAYNSSVDRLHCWDGTVWRRTGHGTPAAPTAADTGGAGAIGAVRYYRVRYTTQSGGVTLRRSEPSAVLTHDATATAAVTVTKPASISENETHWELEASTDNVNFYAFATTVVGTTTVVDSTADGAGYASGTLSADAGDYTVIPSVKFLGADEDRLLGAGNWESAAYASRVLWTPVFADPNGVGNDERLEWDAGPYRDLDNYEGGPITNLSDNINGYVYVTKWSHTYQLIRTRERTRAYDDVPITKTRGALPFSLVEATDNEGIACLFAWDPSVGPVFIGGRAGVETCGTDIYTLFKLYQSNMNGYRSGTATRGVYYPDKRQVMWWNGNLSVRLVLHTQNMRKTEDGFRGGWARWDGDSCEGVNAVCMFSTNIDAGAARNLVWVPFIGKSNGDIWRTDTGVDDNGDVYISYILTRYFIANKMLHDFEIKSLSLLAKGTTDALLRVRVTAAKANGDETNVAGQDVDLTPIEDDGRWVIRLLDDVGNAEANAAFLYYGDNQTDDPTAQWQVESIVMNVTAGQAN